jgi:hypothetical protein
MNKEAIFLGAKWAQNEIPILISNNPLGRKGLSVEKAVYEI